MSNSASSYPASYTACNKSSNSTDSNPLNFLTALPIPFIISLSASTNLIFNPAFLQAPINVILEDLIPLF